MDKFTVRKSIRSGKPEVDAYIEELETELTKRNTSGIYNFILNCNKVAIVLSNDLDLISQGRIDECALLSSDKDDKSVERTMTVLKSHEMFKQISDVADSLVPEIIDTKSEEIKLDPTINAFEAMSERVKERIGGKKA